MEPYKSSLEHVLAELERIDLLIRVQVERARGTLQDEGELQGLYISEQELDAWRPLAAWPKGSRSARRERPPIPSCGWRSWRGGSS